ncbi:glycosyltransferase family 2 protein [Treponema sp. C6A8]|uniref:glycosyltransferase family 2 protein n=1 Tax=Treponema sp. C6A8 TaxID=1410609 RepID=UPI000486DDC4|nr:glycosyltransferase family 2 protein [Treponema sp. C6A8]
MKISIITVCYNSCQTISRTIESVLAQNNVHLEYIIFDGASKDNTVQIAESYRDSFAQKGFEYRINSEPDNGIYDAMNKGINAATGDVIGILNSDDYYASSDVLSSINSCFEQNNTDSVYGDLLYVKNDKSYRYWKSGKQKSFRSGWMPPHPAFFLKRLVYEKYGLFRLDCGINADYELMLRFLEVQKISTIWLNKVCTYMEAGGTSNNGLKARIAGMNNDKLAWEKNGLKPCRFTILLKKLRKLPQFVGARFYSLKISSTI